MASEPSPAEKWHQLIVVEKSMSLSDFMSSKRPGMLSDFPEQREETTEEIIDVIGTFPNDFLQVDEVSLLLDYFLNSIESSALTGGAVIRGVHHLVLTSKNLPTNVEVSLLRVLFKEGNMQSWARKERQLQYDILKWLLKNKLTYLKALGADFLATFMKSVSGERDPRCLVQMFSAFLEISRQVSLGPFTEDMFETIACYFPVEFRPQKDDTITREYLAASCASCLVSSPSYAPFCFLFIDEKLNDDECSDEEYEDVLYLLTQACETFPAQANLSLLEPLIGGIRKIGLNPKNKGEMLGSVENAFEALIKMCVKSSEKKLGYLDRIVSSIVENSEPFVLQAEMGLCKKALTLLRCAFNCLPEKHAQIVLNQVIAWILNLIQGDSVNAAGNRADIVQEGLEYLIEWVQLASTEVSIGSQALSVFEQSIFESCSRAREFKPQEALISIYECASIYFIVGCASEDLASQCRSYIARSLCTPIDTESEFRSLLKLIRIYTKSYFDQVKIVLADNAIDTWNTKKVFPVLCSMSCTNESFEFLLKNLNEHLGKEMDTPNNSLNSYLEMMKHCKDNNSLLLQQFGVFSSALYASTDPDPSAAQILQSITLLLPQEDHLKFMENIATQYLKVEKSELPKFDEKYRLALLQNTNTSDLLKIVGLEIPKRTIRQIYFSVFNRLPVTENIQLQVPEEYQIAELKAKVLRGAPNSLKSFEDLLTNISPDLADSTFEYFLDFESSDCNPISCRYETGSSLWRQRMFCQIVPIFKKKFEESEDRKPILVEMLPHLLKFASSLDSRQLKKQFAMLLPVLIQTISVEGDIPSHVIRTIPMFLTISEPLQLDDLRTVIKYLCSISRNTQSTMDYLEDALNGLNILARRQPPKSLHSEVPLVVTSINRILGHKKRFLRMMAADVKNNWEMVITK